MNKSADRTNRLKVLVVDDDEAFSGAVRYALEASGPFDIRCVDTGETAVETLQRERFDIVFLDYRLPGISGLDVLQWMGEKSIDVPVIFVTAVGPNDVAAEAVRLGAYEYIRKEHLELGHLGLMIEGVRERFMYRRQKERWRAFDKDRENSLVAIEMFHGTLASMARIVYTSLSAAERMLRERESRIRSYVTEPDSQPLTEAFAALDREYRTISASVESVLEVANVLHGSFADADYAHKIHDELHRNLGSSQRPGIPPMDPKDV